MHDWLTTTGHGLILTMLGMVMRQLHNAGIKFDIRIWKNGKEKNGTDQT